MLIAFVPIAVVLLRLFLPGNTDRETPTHDFELVRQMPHDPEAFTQGFLFQDGFFFESTGLNDKSSLRRVDPETGQVLKMVRLDGRYFGEGLSYFKGRLVQLTYHSQKAFVYSSDELDLLEDWDYVGQGWGLTFDGEHFIMSDGSSTLSFRDPKDFATVRTVSVHNGNQLVRNINELEYIKGEIWANIWLTKTIARISPKDGRVLGFIDMRGLLKSKDKNGKEDHFNGIAYDSVGDHIYVTGKYYSNVYEIRLGKRKN